MSPLTRALATAVATAACSGGLVVGAAAPASAGPEDGKGCAGLPAIPQSYVCVISATPANAVPSTTSTNVPVVVPRVCYVADCTGPTTVTVPVPGVQQGSGQVAVLWYQGVYYPISVGTGTLLPIVDGTVTLAGSLAGTALSTATGAVATVTSLAGTTVTTINGIAAGAVGDVQDAVAGLPTTGEVVATVLAAVAPWRTYAENVIASLPTTQEVVNTVTAAAAPWVQYVQDTVNGLPTTDEVIAALVLRLQPYVDTVAGIINSLPTTGEIVAGVRQYVAELVAGLEYAVADLQARIQEIFDGLPNIDEALEKVAYRLEQALAELGDDIARILASITI